MSDKGQPPQGDQPSSRHVPGGPTPVPSRPTGAPPPSRAPPSRRGPQPPQQEQQQYPAGVRRDDQPGPSQEVGAVGGQREMVPGMDNPLVGQPRKLTKDELAALHISGSNPRTLLTSAQRIALAKIQARDSEKAKEAQQSDKDSEDARKLSDTPPAKPKFAGAAGGVKEREQYLSAEELEKRRKEAIEAAARKGQQQAGQKMAADVTRYSEDPHYPVRSEDGTNVVSCDRQTVVSPEPHEKVIPPDHEPSSTGSSGSQERKGALGYGADSPDELRAPRASGAVPVVHDPTNMPTPPANSEEMRLLMRQIAEAKEMVEEDVKKSRRNKRLTFRQLNPLKIEPPQRPNYGKEGRPLMVLTNWFRLDCKDVQVQEDGRKGFIMYRYRVAFMLGTEDQFNSASFPRDKCILKEETDRFEMLVHFVSKYASTSSQAYFPEAVNIAYDGEIVLVSKVPLNFEGEILHLYSQMKFKSDPRRERDVVMEVMRLPIIPFNPHDVPRDLAMPSKDDAGQDAAAIEKVSNMQCINAIMRMNRRAPFTEFYKFFSAVRGGLQIYRVPAAELFANPSPTLTNTYISGGNMHLQGLFSMVKVAGEENTLMLNADVCNAVFRRPLPLMELICILLNEAEGCQKYQINQVNEQAHLNAQQYAMIEQKLIAFDMVKTCPQNPKDGTGPLKIESWMGRPGVAKSVFGMPPRDRFFWRQIAVDEPEITYNLDALPALKAQLEAVRRGGAPTAIRQIRSGQPAASAIVQGGNGHGGNGHGGNGHGGGTNGHGAAGAIPTALLPPPRPGKKWSLITVYDYYTKVKKWPVRLPLMATVNFKSQRDERDYKKRNPRFAQRSKLSKDERKADDNNRLDLSVGVPIEYLRVDYPQKMRQQLDPDQLAAIIKRAALPATDRQKRIMGLIQEADLMKDPWMNRFSISLNGQMLNCKARVLDPPAILIRGRPQSVTEGVWKIPSQFQVHAPGATPVRYWIVLAYQDRDPQLTNILSQFCQNFPREMNRRGLKFNEQPAFTSFFGGADGDFRSVIVKAADELRRIGQDTPQIPGNRHGYPHLCMVILPRRGIETYSDVKRTAEIDFGWVTQCLLKKTITTNWKPMTIDNICLKTNVKTGGTNWNIKPRNPVVDRMLMGERTLLIGMDVNHPTVGDDASPSIAAMCAAWTNDLMSYHGYVRVQKKRRENVVYMRDMASDMMKNWMLRNVREVPARVIIFRDGVADKQYISVVNEEVLSVRRALREALELQENTLPKMTVVVCKKTHHTRFFPMNDREGVGRGKNVPPGLVVDRDILHKNDYDFFMMAHAGIQGTCRPIHYSIVHDEANMDVDVLQAITHALSYTYQRCPRAVKVPAPVYYAHLIAERGRVHLRGQIGNFSDMSSSGSTSGSRPTSRASSAAPSRSATPTGTAEAKGTTGSSSSSESEAFGFGETQSVTEDEETESTSEETEEGEPLRDWISHHDLEMQKKTTIMQPARQAMYWI